MRVKHIGVHRTHCCIAHGCKYGDNDCPVALGEILQDHLCEFCKDLFYQFMTFQNILWKTLKKDL